MLTNPVSEHRLILPGFVDPVLKKESLKHVTTIQNTTRAVHTVFSCSVTSSHPSFAEPINAAAFHSPLDEAADQITPGPDGNRNLTILRKFYGANLRIYRASSTSFYSQALTTSTEALKQNRYVASRSELSEGDKTSSTIESESFFLPLKSPLLELLIVAGSKKDFHQIYELYTESLERLDFANIVKVWSTLLQIQSANQGCFDSVFFDPLIQKTIEKLSQGDPSSLFKIIGLFNKHFFHNACLLAQIAEPLSKHLAKFSLDSIAILAWNFTHLDFKEINGFKNTDFLDNIAEQAIGRSSELNPTNITRLLTAFGAARYNHLELTSLLRIKICYQISHFSSNQVALVLFGLGQLEIKENSLIALLEEMLSCKFQETGPLCLSYAAMGFSQFDIINTPLMTSIGEVLTAKISNLNGSALGFAACAYRTPTIKNEALKKAIFEKVAAANLSTFSIRSLIMLAHTMMYHGPYHLSAVQKIAEETQRRLDAFSPPDLVQIIFSLICLDFIHKPLIDQVAQKLTYDISSLSSYDLSCLAFCFGDLNNPSKELMEALCNQSLLQIDQFTPYELGVLAFSLGKASYSHKPLQRAILKQAASLISKFESSDIARIFVGFGNLSFRDITVMAELINQLIKKAAQFTAEEIALICYGLSKMGLKHHSFMNLMAQKAIQHIKEFNSSEIAKLCYSFKDLEIKNKALVKAIHSQIVINHSSLQIQELEWVINYLEDYGIKDSDLRRALAHNKSAVVAV